MGIREVRKELKNYDKSELIKLISDLYKNYKPVKEFIEFQLHPQEDKLLSEYKLKVRECFFPKKGFDLKQSVAKSEINTFKKLKPSQQSISDLMFYYVECGIQFTTYYGDINERFYTSLENVFDSAMKIVSEENLLSHFSKRISNIVRKSSNIGWGFGDYIQILYSKYTN